MWNTADSIAEEWIQIMIKLSLSIHLLELIKKVIPSISGLLDYYAVRQLINHNLVWRSFLFQIFFCRTTGLVRQF